jgi:hypothetical protein
MEEKKKSPLLRYLLIGAIVILGIGAVFFFFSKNQSSAEPSTISGQIDYNGLKPTGKEDTSLVKVKLMARPYGQGGEYETLNVDVPLEDNANWEWTQAEVGKTYEIISEITYKDISVKKSTTAVATAPAEGIVLVFNITKEDIEAVKDQGASSETNTNDPATVSGAIAINGFIPSGSVVNIYGRKAGTKDEFKEALSDLPAKPTMTFAYKNAVAGETYEYQAELYNSSGTFIGQSNYITVTAPANNELVTINSTAQAPSQKATITGNIKLNGNLQQGSTVLLLQRKSGQTDYQVIDRYPANKSIDYTWNGATAGVVYDITAALQVNEQNTATGNVVTVTAPATGVNLTIDTNFNLQPPTSTPQVSCGGADQTNHFNATISVPQIENAKKYQLEVGTSAGANNTLNQTLQPGQTANIYIPAESPYFTRYAYTACTDCEINNSSNWSGWSPTLGFKCPQ